MIVFILDPLLYVVFNVGANTKVLCSWLLGYIWYITLFSFYFILAARYSSNCFLSSLILPLLVLLRSYYCGRPWSSF